MPQAENRQSDPLLDFPAFPDPFDGEGKPIPVLEGEAVKIPLFYWRSITEYVIDVEKTQEQYEAWQKIYITP
jgi:hypothetical protein